ncbi:MAG: nicotinate-nucleotide adenylyltransferase [Chloroflexi bacterium]|nr:nicotinate-nucleotide adenylyltransferase [Chloroflexota bacterium]
MKIGVLGGTFDPIHYGHLVAGENAGRAMGLDKVLFVPSVHPPHKAEYPVTDAELRVQMIELAIADNSYFELSRNEFKRPGPSYTVEMIESLQEELGASAELHFILGEDALADLPEWHQPQRLLELCQLIAVNRPGYHSFSVKLLEPQLPGVERRVHQIRIPELAVWSTELRARISSGLSVRYLVPDAVHDFIYAHGLYLSGESLRPS